MRKLITATVLAVVAFGLAVVAFHGHAARSCTFDGGGTIASGDAARTSEGTVWMCQDGQLIRI